MPRRARIAPGGHVFHILNRANGLTQLFEGPACYRDFLRLVAECADLTQMRVLAYCAMPNHWHMLVWPRQAGDLRRFVQRLTSRHSHRWHVRNHTVGRGHLYQDRFKSFVVQDDAHLLTVCRYIERNPLRAGLVSDAARWPWSSVSSRTMANDRTVSSNPIRLEPLPVETPADWLCWVNEPQTEAELYQLRAHVDSGYPFGDQAWKEGIAPEGQSTRERRRIDRDRGRVSPE